MMVVLCTTQPAVSISRMMVKETDEHCDNEVK